jgi:hypothetical protein
MIRRHPSPQSIQAASINLRTRHLNPLPLAMKPIAPTTQPRAAFVLTLGLLFSLSGPLLSENTNEMYKPTGASRGGLNPRPEITRFQAESNTATLEWFGLQGPYQIESRSTLEPADWQTLLQTSERKATVPVDQDNAFFRIQGGHPNYIGAASCLDCHPQAHAGWETTAHSRAFDRLKAINQHNNTRCFACHTTGYGFPLGFQSETTTPHLRGVQCESCHGPGGSHASNPADASLKPIVTLAAEICGGCHNAHNRPTFTEWTHARHSHVTPSVASGFISAGEPRMLQCGACHSGAVRMALLNQLDNPHTPLPARVDAAYFPVTCTTCHNAHDNTLHSQLRNPVYSTDFFSYSTSANTTFAAQYNPQIQLCGQCHNQRGADWTGTARPPHHSPQYNMLVGKIVPDGTADDVWNSIPSTHGNQPLQCTACHTHPTTVALPGAENPHATGHTFEMRIESCVECHGTTETAQLLIVSTQSNIKTRIQEVKTLLDDWAVHRASEPLREKYGALTWEFNFPGDLSNPNGDSSLRGPTPAEQSGVPNEIKKARFLLYLVAYDGSYGLHNGRYARFLLDEARQLIAQAP